MTLILSRSQIEELVDMPATIDAVELAFKALGQTTACQPKPEAMSLPSSSAHFLPMAALADHTGMAAVKLLADIPSNQARQLPSQRSTISLVSQDTGETLAILDGRAPTRVRTAAASAVATKYLARQDSSTLGLVGAGALAVAHLEAMLQVRPISEVLVWSRSQATVDAFRAQTECFGVRITAAGSVREVVKSADIVCTLTPSTEPLVKGEWFRPGQHINAVGARPRSTHREIDTAGMTGTAVFVDDMATALSKSGDLLVPINEGAMSAADVRGELAAVVAGANVGRHSAAETTLYDSVGIGLQDLAIGQLIYERALAAGAGVDIDLSA